MGQPTVQQEGAFVLPTWVDTAMLPDWSFRLANQLGVYLVLTAMAYMVIRAVRANPPGADDQSLYARAARFLVLGYDALPGSSGNPNASASANSSNNGDGGGGSSSQTTEAIAGQTPKPKPPKPAAGDGPVGDGPSPEQRSKFMQGMMLAYCTTGLMGFYLLWGVLQERIMATEYATGRFESSTFLVFSNRVFALGLAVPMIMYKNEGLGTAPFYKYALTSLSNTMSSWFQLESLKYLSFPIQVLGKSSKLVPVMLMGKVLSGKRYPWYEYGVALAVTLGVSMFLLAQTGGGKDSTTTQLSGLILMLGYLGCDSFTSQWQDQLFKEYGLSTYQMMFGINSFSAIVTLASLLQSGELWTSLDFLAANPDAILHISGFSIAGAIGQQFIYTTIREFGPLIFTLISTLRQLVSIFLSMIIYGHSITAEGAVGVFIVFGALAWRTWKKDAEAKESKERAKRAKSGEVVQPGDEESVALKTSVSNTNADGSGGSSADGTVAGASASGVGASNKA